LLLIGAVFLCLLSFTLQTTQLKVVLLERGIDSAAGSLAISLFATSTIVGRLLCGVALDRFPAYAVAALFLGLPGVGLSLLAVGPAQPAAMSAAVGLLGLSMGSEGDVWAYLVAKYFRPEVYGTVLGLVFCAMALSTGIGALCLSRMLQWSGGYTPFLVASAALVFIGSGLLLFLKDCTANRPFLLRAQPLEE
jgi:predicted MFS family arabinose efflux permease